MLLADDEFFHGLFKSVDLHLKMIRGKKKCGTTLNFPLKSLHIRIDESSTSVAHHLRGMIRQEFLSQYHLHVLRMTFYPLYGSTNVWYRNLFIFSVCYFSDIQWQPLLKLLLFMGSCWHLLSVEWNSRQ